MNPAVNYRTTVEAALLAGNLTELSNRAIGRLLGIHDGAVGKWRRRMEDRGEIPRVTLRVARDGRIVDVSTHLRRAGRMGTQWVEMRENHKTRCLGTPAEPCGVR
jgi:hypothetical protein